MKKEEYNRIFDALRTCLIFIPQECILLRFKDVVRILTDFIEQENPDLVTCPLCRGGGLIPRASEDNDIPMEELDEPK